MTSSNKQSERKDSPSKASLQVQKSLTKLTTHALRVELLRRNLNTYGMRNALEDRLRYHLQAMKTSRQNNAKRARTFPTFITVPTTFDPAITTPYYRIQPTAHNDHDKEEEEEEGEDEGEEEDKDAQTIPGVLRMRCVWVCGDTNMRQLWKKSGPIGKANLSRSAPAYSTPEADPQKGRAMRQLQALQSETANGETANGETHHQKDDMEHLQLTLIEAYYTAFIQRHLTIYHDNEPMQNPRAVWEMFNKIGGENFAGAFVAYCRYRTVGWIPRSGLKYGVDWVLYPGIMDRHTHSPFCVVLKFVHKKEEEDKKVDRTWVSLQSRLRLVNNVAKTLVVAQVDCREDKSNGHHLKNAFKHTHITELTIDRWVS